MRLSKIQDDFVKTGEKLKEDKERMKNMLFSSIKKELETPETSMLKVLKSQREFSGGKDPAVQELKEELKVTKATLL